MDRKLCSQQNP